MPDKMRNGWSVKSASHSSTHVVERTTIAKRIGEQSMGTQQAIPKGKGNIERRRITTIETISEKLQKTTQHVS